MGGLQSYIIRRTLLMIPTLIGVTLLIFAITQVLSPTQRAALYATEKIQPGQMEEIIEKYHLNDPVYVQYFIWLQQVLSGNLGWTKKFTSPVLNIILSRAPASIELGIVASPIIVISGIYFGKLAAVHRDKMIDHISRATSIIGWSLPSFWLGILLLAIFYSGLGWFSPGRLGDEARAFVTNPDNFKTYTGMYTIDGLLNGQPWITLDALSHIVLPVVSLTIQIVALMVRVMRSTMLEALGKGYISAARAKGLTQKEVINKHATRNALIPVVTLAGMLTAGLITGVTITEIIFNYPGLGQFAATCALPPSDLPGVLGFALLVGIVFVAVNLIVDVSYAYLDPRIRLG